MTESATQSEIRVRMSMLGGHLWRNNVGAVKIRDNHGERFIRYGLANDNPAINKKFKSSDLIGLTPRIIRPEDVGRLFGIFTAAEIKAPGWYMIQSDDRAHAQAKFHDAVKQCGGFAGFITHADELERMIL